LGFKFESQKDPMKFFMCTGNTAQHPLRRNVVAIEDGSQDDFDLKPVFRHRINCYTVYQDLQFKAYHLGQVKLDKNDLKHCTSELIKYNGLEWTGKVTSKDWTIDLANRLA
jgi:hypothetical protein